MPDWRFAALCYRRPGSYADEPVADREWLSKYRERKQISVLSEWFYECSHFTVHPCQYTFVGSFVAQRTEDLPGLSMDILGIRDIHCQHVLIVK